jgi:hypothetical protein
MRGSHHLSDELVASLHELCFDAANLRVTCRAHNRLHAEPVFGRRCVERGIHFRQQKSALDAATRGLVLALLATAYETSPS